ncbi:MAG TPA: hypothetical protein VGD87_00845, partial [Archangium sp.]
MTASSTKLLLLASLLGMVVQGCRCPGDVTERSRGEVRIIYTDATGTQVSGENGIYDFGTISMGKTEVKKLTVQNTGLGSLTVSTFTKVSGSAVKVGSQIDDPGAVFTIAFEETQIPSGGSA